MGLCEPVYRVKVHTCGHEREAEGVCDHNGNKGLSYIHGHEGGGRGKGCGIQPVVKLQGHVKMEDYSVANGRSRIPCKREMKNFVRDCGSAFVIYRSGSSIFNKIWMRIQIMDPDL
jgi:hypothetical protein